MAGILADPAAYAAGSPTAKVEEWCRISDTSLVLCRVSTPRAGACPASKSIAKDAGMVAQKLRLGRVDDCPLPVVNHQRATASRRQAQRRVCTTNLTILPQNARPQHRVAWQLVSAPFSISLRSIWCGRPASNHLFAHSPIHRFCARQHRPSGGTAVGIPIAYPAICDLPSCQKTGPDLRPDLEERSGRFQQRRASDVLLRPWKISPAGHVVPVEVITLRGRHDAGALQGDHQTCNGVGFYAGRMPVFSKGAIIRRCRDAAPWGAGATLAAADGPGPQRHHGPKIVVPICAAKISVQTGGRLRPASAMVPVCFILPSSFSPFRQQLRGLTDRASRSTYLETRSLPALCSTRRRPSIVEGRPSSRHPQKAPARSPRHP